MLSTALYWWFKVPFGRLVLWLMGGILLQWYLQPFMQLSWILLLCGTSILFLSFFAGHVLLYKWRHLLGMAAFLSILSIGMLLTSFQDVRNHSDWFGKEAGGNWIVRLDETISEKTNTFKTTAKVYYRIRPGKQEVASGKVIIYFKKDNASKYPDYGSVLLINKPLQPIKNSGNPGCFNYERYCYFTGITHQVFLNRQEYHVLNSQYKHPIYTQVIQSRKWVLSVLSGAIREEKEKGLAEALLIGYKDDLDKELVKAYTNTGTIHVIAISGLHLGLIYILALWLTRFLDRNSEMKWLQLGIVILSLWIFSLLAGMGPSVLRSAVMFSFIACGRVINRQTSVYNTLCLSAFFLLCFQPFWLWDAGFQLSYAAVLSIISFYKPLYQFIEFSNRFLDGIWQMIAVTLSAQLLTLPVALYHFNQFPNLFLFTNLVAVPLSSIILIAEIILCLVSFSSFLLENLGYATGFLIRQMNDFIENISATSIAVSDNIDFSFSAACMLFIFIVAFSCYLTNLTKAQLYISLIALMFYCTEQSLRNLAALRQAKLIVYNIPRQSALDLVEGRQYVFKGDALLRREGFLRNFHLDPARTFLRTSEKATVSSQLLFANNKMIMVLNRPQRFPILRKKHVIDVLILSGKHGTSLKNILQSFTIRQCILDGSVPAFRAKIWLEECSRLGIPCFNVNKQGAFIMNLNEL